MGVILRYGLHNIYTMFWAVIPYGLGRSLLTFRNKLLPAPAVKMEVVDFSEAILTICQTTQTIISTL